MAWLHFDACWSFQTVPILIGVGVVAVTAVLAKVFIFGKKKKAPVTLQDPMVKYPLELVDKIVSTDLILDNFLGLTLLRYGFTGYQP
jgi:hypothetical protein